MGAELSRLPTGRPAGRSRQRPPTGLLARTLRLRHIQPTWWQRALLLDGSVVLALLLVLAELVSVWTVLVLPLAVAVVVKAHDVLAGALAITAAAPPTRQRRRPDYPVTTTAPPP